MTLTESLSSDARRQTALLLAVWVPICILAYMVGMQPYASGYGFVRFSILGIAATQWSGPEWEHCGLVPLACAFILYLDKERLEKIVPRPSGWGLVVAALGFLVFWAGYRVDNYYIGYASVQILLTGMILTVLGWQFLWALIFPLFFLTFMWPLVFLESVVAVPLRLIMSEYSVVVLNFIGIPAIRNGSQILSAPESLGGFGVKSAGALFSVDVADPCSGIRSLFALMMVSALYGYFTMTSWWKRLVLFIFAVPLAVLGNLCRILMLTIGTLAFGSKFAIGEGGGLEEPSTFHMFSGFLVFGVALAGMIGVQKLLDLNPAEIIQNFRNLGADRKIAAKVRAEKSDAKPVQHEDEY